MSNAPTTRDRSAGAIDAVVIGAGQAGLAASWRLRERGIRHVVLERGEVGNSWRTERWDSLKLLTQNWQCQLPGYGYAGRDPEGFMDMQEFIGFLDGYARMANTPLVTQTTVTSLQSRAGGFDVVTNNGDWFAKSVIIATGACNSPNVPKSAAALPESVMQLTPHDYRNPSQLGSGGVLIVGGSATGLQFAEEISRAGFNVTLAVGEHVRMPRRYRGRDIQYWMHRTGANDLYYEDFDDPVRVRKLPSAQIVGSNEFEILDLNRLQSRGVRVAGRLMDVRDGVARFSGTLRNVCRLADLKMNRLLDMIDEWVEENSVGCGEKQRFNPTRVDEKPLLQLDLEQAGIGTVIWATGFRPDYSWLHADVLDRKGRLRHDGGVIDAPGLYALGLPMMRRRKSSFIYGASDDSRDIVGHLADYLDRARVGRAA